MSKFWDSLAVIVLGFFAISILATMIQPYIGLMLLAGTVVVGGVFVFKKARYW